MTLRCSGCGRAGVQGERQGFVCGARLATRFEVHPPELSVEESYERSKAAMVGPVCMGVLVEAA